LVATVLKGAETDLLNNNRYSDELLDGAIQPFILKNIQDVCLYLELFGSLPQFVGVFSVIIKMASRTCGLKLEELYTKIISLILQVFGLNPQHNYQLLDAFGDLILRFRDSEIQKNWLSENLHDFNTSILTYLSNHNDPDLLNKWIQILSNIYQIYPEYLLSAPDIDKVLEFLLLVFSNAAEYESLKNISNFFNKIVENKTMVMNETTIKIIPKIINAFFHKLLNLDNIAMIVKPLSNILVAFQEEKDHLIQLLCQSLNIEQYQELSEENRNTFLQAIYLYRADTRSLNNIIRSFKDFVNSKELMPESMIFIQDKVAHYGQAK